MSTTFFYRDFFKRVEDADDFPSLLYKQKITPKRRNTKEDRLFMDCFSNHIEYHDHTRKTLVCNKESSSLRFINQDILSAYFINEIYEVPDILDFESYSDTDNKDENVPIKYHKYLKDISQNSITEDGSGQFDLGSNALRFVVGDIGIGKSAFLKKLICDIESNNFSDAYTVVPVYMNLEEIFNIESKPTPLKDEFDKKLFYRIVESVKNKISNFKIECINYIVPQEDDCLAIKQLIAELKQKKIRLIIFIDNLDFYHYYNARYSFFEEYEHDQEQIINDNIIWGAGRGLS